LDRGDRLARQPKWLDVRFRAGVGDKRTLGSPTQVSSL
jgi:hypothetical protein